MKQQWPLESSQQEQEQSWVSLLPSACAWAELRVCTKYRQESPLSAAEHSRVQQKANIFTTIEVASISTHKAPNSFWSKEKPFLKP